MDAAAPLRHRPQVGARATPFSEKHVFEKQFDNRRRSSFVLTVPPA